MLVTFLMKTKGILVLQERDLHICPSRHPSYPAFSCPIFSLHLEFSLISSHCHAFDKLLHAPFIPPTPPRSPQQSCLLSCEKVKCLSDRPSITRSILVYQINLCLSDPPSIIRSNLNYQTHPCLSDQPSMTCLNVSM